MGRLTGTDSKRHRLPSADAAFLRMDRPTNLMVINFVMLFDELLDEARLRAVIRARLVERYPRFSELVVEGLRGASGPYFTEDPHFDLDRHIHRRALPASPLPPGETGSEDALRAGADDALQELVSELIATPLERSKPLWDMYLLERASGGCAVVVRIHHCIVDGIALAQVMLSLTDATPDTPPEAAPAQDSLVAARSSHVRVYRGGERGRGDTLRVRGTAAGAAANARALAKLLFTPPDARTALRGRLGVSKRVAWTERLDLALVKATARAQGASVNDVLLAAVSGALRRHLQERGEQPRAIRTLVPFNLRPLEEPIPRALGNRFGLVFLTLPVDVAGTRERLRELGRRMAAIKDSREGPVSYAILQGIGMTPRRVERRIIDIFTAKASAMTTNVPGPREVVYMAGAPLRAVLVWAPVSGSVGITVSIFSYHDGVTIGLLVDAGLVPDPQTLARDTELELADLAKLEPIAEIVRR
jgi:diacylglycerol O-acyltransferase / wax synthase